MKRLITTCIAIAGFLFTTAFAQVEKPKQEIELTAEESTVKLKQGTVVPANETYDVYDESGNLLGRYTAGKVAKVPVSKSRKPMNCVQIGCPKTFKKGTICWKCRG